MLHKDEPDGTAAVLDASSLSKSYSSPDRVRKLVLSNVSFSIKRGEFVSIFGPNGSGKTTLLRVISGIESSDSGRVLRSWGADGKPPGVVFQNYSETLLPWSTAADNICFPLLAAGATTVERKAAAGRMVKELGLSFDMAQYPYKLSGGQQQTCCIARALVHDPAFLMMDEPFSALDIETRQRMQQKILDIWSVRKLTVIMVTHDLDEAILLASRFILLEGPPGRIGLDLPVDLPYPRTIGLLETREFFDIRSTILGTIRRDLTG